MVSNNSSVDENGDFNSDWFRLSFLDSDLLEDFLDLVEIDDSSGHGHESGGKGFANTFSSDEELHEITIIMITHMMYKVVSKCFNCVINLHRGS